MSSEPWTVGRLLAWTTDFLKSHGSDSPRLDAEVLLAEALGCQRIALYTAFDTEPGEAERTKFREFVRRRAEGMPVAYLVGRREFFSLSFQVTPDVLIPRPETELLVVATLDWAKGDGGRGTGGVERGEEQGLSTSVPSGHGDNSVSSSVIHIADVGTGSGVIAVCLAKHLPGCRVTAVDVSPAALAVARKNADQHAVSDRIEFLESDLFAAVPADRRFDFVVSNPPYVTTAEIETLPPDVRKFEPHQALLGGPSGTEVIERLIDQSAERLLPGGHLLMEISPTIHDRVRALLASDARFELLPTIKDLARLPRVVQARKQG